MLCRAIPYEGREPYIFFSYSHKDSERVYPLLEQMVRDGYRVWYDDGNHPGDDWLENIGQHLNNCHLCLAMMSQNSEESHNCKKEVSFAVQCNKKLMAVMLEKFAMTVGMRLQLSTIHYLVRTEYPSDKVLLEKLYETESMRACRAVPGSLRMRTIAEEPRQKTAEYPEPEALQSFVRETIPEKPEEIKAESRPAPEAHSGKDAAKAKPLKVKAKIKPGKKALKQEPAADENFPVTEPEAVSAPEKPGPVAERPEPAPEKPGAAPEKPGPAPEKPEPAPEKPEPAPEKPGPAPEPVTRESAVPEAEARCGEVPQKEPEAPLSGQKTVLVAKEAAAPVAEQPARGKILLLRLGDGTSYVSGKDSVQVGRSDKRCDFVLQNNPLISNHHVNIILENGGCCLQDAGSSNGTFLGGERLQANSRIQVENAVKFQICKEEFMLFYGAEVGDCVARGAIAYLRNPVTGSARILSSEVFPLGRQYKWEDGSLSNGGISRRHAQICRDSEGYYLEDLGSKNGTYCNEQRLASNSKCRLASGDKIRLVDTVLEMNIVTL